MVKYILLEDEKTGAKLSAGVLATSFLYANNPAKNDDAKVAPLVRSAAGKATLREQEHFLLGRLKEFQAKNDTAGVNAVMDAMTYFIARNHFQKALDSGEGQIASPSYMGFRSTAFQVARAEESRVKSAEFKQAYNDKQEAEVARRAARTPEQAAMEELVNVGHRPRVQAVLDQFDGKGLTDNAIRTRLLNQQEGMGFFGSSWDKAMALQVFDRAQEIEKGAKPGKPIGAYGLDEAHAAPKKKPAAAKKADEPKEDKASDKPAFTDRQMSVAAEKLVFAKASPEAQAKAREYLVLSRDAGTTAERLAAVGQALQDLEDGKKSSDPHAYRNLRLAAGVLFLKGKMEAGNSTNFKNTDSREFFDAAEAAARKLGAKLEAGEDISQTYAPAGGESEAIAKASGTRAKRYGYGGESAPAETEIPVIAENQVKALQKQLIAAGMNVGTMGADGKYGPNTHKALKAFAAKMDPAITDLSKIDCTNEDSPEYKQLMEALGAAKGKSKASAAPVKAASADTAEVKADAPTTELTAAGKKLLAAVDKHKGLSDEATAAVNLVSDEKKGIFTALANARNVPGVGDSALYTGLDNAGLGLSKDEVRSLKFTGSGASDLQVSGDTILNIEKLINSLGGKQVKEDGVLDAFIGAVIAEKGLLADIRAALSGSAPLAVASNSAPVGTPGQGGGAAKGV